MPEIFWCSCSGCWDLRDSPPSPAFQNSKAHTMGVCCIVKSPYDPNVLLTGSYDEHLRVWDMRSTSKPVNEASVCLGGGVWRIKCHSSEPNLVLAACMHNGFAIVEMDEEKLQVKEIYSKHGRLRMEQTGKEVHVVMGGTERIVQLPLARFMTRCFGCGYLKMTISDETLGFFCDSFHRDVFEESCCFQ